MLYLVLLLLDCLFLVIVYSVPLTFIYTNEYIPWIVVQIKIKTYVSDLARHVSGITFTKHAQIKKLNRSTKRTPENKTDQRHEPQKIKHVNDTDPRKLNRSTTRTPEN
jgi:hypothetical protein